MHFSLAASQLAATRIVGPVGDDFGAEEYAILHRRGVLTDDVEHIAGGKTFFWHGRYHRDINQRDTLQTDLNVFEDFRPKLSQASRDAEVLFLGNIQPDLQREVREQCRAARFVAMDSMNLWIDIAHEALLATVALVDCLVLNDSELKQLTDEPNLIRAAHKALDLGPRVVIAKQGEYGSAMITRDGFFGLTLLPDDRDRRADRRRRHVRRRPDGLPRRARRRRRRRGAAPRDGLRHRVRVVQRRGLRLRAPVRARPRRGRRAGRRRSSATAAIYGELFRATSPPPKS